MRAKRKTAAELALEGVNNPPEPPPPPGAPKFGYGKISVSMFPADFEAADRLVDFLWRHCGVRATRSNALRLAVRFAADLISPEEARERYEAVRRDDRRLKGNGASSDGDKI